MVDRSETRQSKQWLNPTLISSPFPQSHLLPGTATTPRIQERRITPHGFSSRTINLDSNRHLNRSHPSRTPTQRFRIQNNERVEASDEQSTQATSEHQQSSRINQNLLESVQQDAPAENSNSRVEERLACEITMIYEPTTILAEEKSSRQEIIVIQRYSTGETSLVYQGYLSKGETFSFKSQRRSTSNLSLAFYVDGLNDSTTNECCEFKCIPTESNGHDQKQFLFKDIQKANPCDKCRKDYTAKLLLNNDKNTLIVRTHPQSNNMVSSFYAGKSEVYGSSSKHQQKKKPSTTKKSTSTELSLAHHQHHAETTTTKVNDDSSKGTTTETIPVVPTTESTEKKSEDNPQDSTETATVTIDGTEIDFQLIMQMFQHHQSATVKRHAKSVENFCYILEKSIPISNDEQQTLRGLINFGVAFDDINSEESIKFLQKILSEKVILILSKTSMENLSKPIQNEQLLCAIYVIDSSETNSFDSKFYRGSFSNMTKFCKQLEDDLQLLTYDLTSVSSVPPEYTGMSTLNYVQALKDILLETDNTRDGKKEMIDFCREEYAENVIQLKLIDEFDKNFQSNDAIRWYLRHETFIYKMLTRALRVLDPDILFKLRYFIQHLNRQLTLSTSTSPLTVYRTLRILKDPFRKMKKNQGGLLSFNEFFLASKNQSATQPSSTNATSTMVHFQIVLEDGVSRYDVSTNPNEILLTIGTIFRIDKVESIDEEIFTVKLTTNDNIHKAGQLMTKDLRDATQSHIPLVRMLKLMKQKDLTGSLEYFCLLLIDDKQAAEDQTANLILGGILHSLGTHYYERKQYEQAFNHLQNSLKVYLRVLPENDARLTPTYNNIGSIYNKQGSYEQALEYHRRAYEIQKNLPKPDMDSVAAYAGNIGSVLMKLERYKEAIRYLDMDLQIQRKRHSNKDHPSVAVKYHNLAGAQYHASEYSEALDSYQKCLDIELKCHTADNPTVAVTYYNMATALEALGRSQEAREAVKKAIARLLLTKKEDDEEVQRQRRYLQRLEEKAWMKDLFAGT